ncbi:MAG: glutathione S-transferase [Pseudomonadota bacterium]
MVHQNKLFSFRRCPYAMRARMALYVSGVSVIVEEVELKNKPSSLLAVSAKGTVPVLVLEDGKVLEESLEIMLWCMQKNDPKYWLNNLDESLTLIEKNDVEFKPYLDFYKYSDRYPNRDLASDKTQAEKFLTKLEERLISKPFLISSHATLADIAIFPFIRQLVMVDSAWFKNSPYSCVHTWLNQLMQSNCFIAIMQKDLSRIN